MEIGLHQKMLRELNEALKKPGHKWAMVIDNRKCVGCYSCVVSCAAENVAPPGTSLRLVYEAETGDYTKADRFFMPVNCMQCDNAPCKEAADKIEKGIVTRRPDGIVVFDYEKLKKNKKAREAIMEACPYKVVFEDKGGFYTENTPVFEKYEEREFFDIKKLTRKGNAMEGTLRKCDFCIHRVENGLLPVCVTTCIGGAIYFGDINDPNSTVSKKVRENKTFRMYEENKPNVYYIGFKTRESFVPSNIEKCVECHG